MFNLLSFFALFFFLSQQAFSEEGFNQTLQTIEIIATSPAGGTGVALDKYPGNAQKVDLLNVQPDISNLADLLNQSIGAISINDTQGNAFQVDLNYRGFSASPVLGTPQGISVFLDGIRVNEPFGDVVSWDLIPQIALSEITLIPGSNPTYGLNTLGGSLSMNTKSGFSYKGNEAKITLGSFGRKSIDAQTGGNENDVAYYFATIIYNENGWAIYNPNQIRQIFGKLSLRNDSATYSLTTMYSDNNMYGNQTVPLSMLSDAALGYSHPDYTTSQNILINLKGDFYLNDFNSLIGSVYYKDIKRDIFNSNLSSLVGTANGGLTGLAALPDTCNTNTPPCDASNIFSSYVQNIFGTNLLWSNNKSIGGHEQVLNLGFSAENGRTQFNNNGQYASVTPNYSTVGAAQFMPQSTIASVNNRYSLFATDTFDLTKKLALTISARYDYATVNLSGISCTDPNSLCTDLSNLSQNPGINSSADVSGNHAYHRLNPSIGATYQFQSKLIGFMDYSQGFRTPTALELACADSANPCNGVPNSFSSDPDLKAVVSKTYELGLRSNVSELFKWKTAIFVSNLYDDILFNQTALTSGYFSNVGQTRREGVELDATGMIGKLDYSLDASYVKANFETPFGEPNTNNSCTLNGTVLCIVNQGSVIPGVPELVAKIKLGYSITASSHITATIIGQSSQYARGDESNKDSNGQVPGFATLKLGYYQKLGKNLDAFVGANNVFNKQYSTFGMLSTNNLTTGNSEQFRGISAPRSLYFGLKGSL